MIAFPDKWRNLKVVLAHDWLTGMRGGERVLEWLCNGFPDAPIMTLICNPTAISPTITRHKIHTSFLQSIPGARRHFRMLLPLFPFAAERMNAPPADILISTSHCAAKAIKPPAGAKHLCYCFTPMRYAWLFREDYFGAARMKRALVGPMLDRLCRWDRRTCDRVDLFVALGRNVKDRISRFYGRDARVVHPPVNIEYWTPLPPAHPRRPGPVYDLVVSALAPYKRIDLAITAYNNMGEKLLVAGEGGEMERLKTLAGPSVSFLGRLPDAEILELYRNARFVVFPGEEDFGIVPVEAQACGRPVIAFGKGGALETVRHGVSGLLFDKQTPDCLTQAVRDAETRLWDSPAIRANAEKFGVEKFLAGMAECIEECLSMPPRR